MNQHPHTEYGKKCAKTESDKKKKLDAEENRSMVDHSMVERLEKFGKRGVRGLISAETSLYESQI